MSILIDATIITLLVVTIGFAAVLNRRLALWRQDRAEFERLIAAFNEAAARANAGVERLKAASEQTGKTLQQAVTKGQSLREDLAYLIERAEPLADRMTDGVRAARALRRAETQAASNPSPAPLAEKAGPDDGAADERTRSKRELLRALAALR